MQPEAETMLLDRFLPQYDVTETHAVVVDADTELTWQAARRGDLSQSAVIRALLECAASPIGCRGSSRGIQRNPPVRR